MNQAPAISQIIDRGGRRSGVELRQFSYSDHIPERRSNQDRRCGPDRRSGLDRRTFKERRCATDEKGPYQVNSNVIDMRNHKDRRKEMRRAAFDKDIG